MPELWINKREVRSSTSGRKYVVSQNQKTGKWACSCPGWRNYGGCKHLDEAELPSNRLDLRGEANAILRARRKYQRQYGKVPAVFTSEDIDARADKNLPITEDILWALRVLGLSSLPVSVDDLVDAYLDHPQYSSEIPAIVATLEAAFEKLYASYADS